MTLEELELKKEELLKGDKTFDNFFQLCIIEKLKDTINSYPEKVKIKFECDVADVNNLKDFTDNLDDMFHRYFNELEEVSVEYIEVDKTKETEIEYER